MPYATVILSSPVHLVERGVCEQDFFGIVLLWQSEDDDGDARVDRVVHEEEHGIVEGLAGPIGVDGVEELARERGHVLVEAVLHQYGKTSGRVEKKKEEFISVRYLAEKKLVRTTDNPDKIILCPVRFQRVIYSGYG